MSVPNQTNTISKDSNLTMKRWIYIAISVLALILVKNITFPTALTTVEGASLTPQGQDALAVLVFALLLSSKL